MEDIEPWNMFSSDFVAEETEELLTDELMAKYGQSDEQITVVKQEATNSADDYNMEVKQENDTSNYSRPNDESNDNELFNFSLDRDVDVPVQPVQDEETSGSDQGSSSRIDYDSAIIFVCPACGVELDSHEKWKLHIDYVHKYSTRRGLNFVQVDKLYHQCLECKRKIAMHSMENLLKHKFTHLPYKRAKCKICLKQYKYRQDIMVHLRMNHRDDMINTNKFIRTRASITRSQETGRLLTNFEIKNVQENAVDIFESTVEGVEVKSEPIVDDENEDEFPTSSVDAQQLSNFDESLSRSSSHLSDTSMLQRKNFTLSKEELCEKLYIQYICPQCGAEFPKQTQWRQHIEYVHNFGTRKALNFKEVNLKQHAQCLECGRVFNVNVIRNLQIHKFTHLPYKSWLRCKLCFRTFVGQKEIVKHLLTQHRLGEEVEPTTDSQDAPLPIEDGQESGADSQPLEPSREERPNDNFEPHIDYLCPQCGKEFFDKRLWRKHIVKVHHLTNMKVLNFKVISDREVMCLECCKTITNAYGVQNAQQHKFTHLPYKSFVRCRLCSKSYTDRKGLVKHLKSKHRLGDETVTQPVSYSPSLQEQAPLPVQKEIVKHADFTFEIKYLNDEDEANDTVDDDTPVPELSFNASYSQFLSLKCKQCTLAFSTQAELQAHINEEHEFLDFNNLRPLPEGPRTSYRNHTAGENSVQTHTRQDRPLRRAVCAQEVEEEERTKRNECREDFLNSSDSNNDLLIPTGDEEISSCSQEAAGIEKNFCYLCPNCGFECATQMLWRRHINDVHNYDKRHALNFRQVDKFRYQCLQCMDIVSGLKLKGLQDHKFRHLPYRLYIKCMLCGTCYNHKPNMMSHMRQRHNITDTRTSFEGSNEQINSMPVLTRATTNKTTITSASPSAAPPAASLSKLPPIPKNVGDDSLNYHNAVDHESITYFCPQCNLNFVSHVQWRKHIVDLHNLNSRQGLNFRQIDEHHFLCLQCYKRVTVTHTKGAIGQLQSHKFRHLPYKSFKCTSCNSDFVRKQMFFKHLNKETNQCDNKVCEEEQDEPNSSPSPLQQPKANISVNVSVSDSSCVVNTLENNYQDCFILICPQCGQQFDSQRQWREHINNTHDFIKRETLNFKKVNSNLHECQQCFEHVSGNKLRDLQTHKFKHLPFGAYIQCRYCNASYSHMRNIQDHLKLKHRNIIQKANGEFDEITFPDDEENGVEADEQYLLG